MSCSPRPSRWTEDRLLAAAREAVAAGLLTADGDGYAFSHALIRQVLYAQLLPGERRGLHRSLAEALAARPGAEPGQPGPALASGRLPGPGGRRGPASRPATRCPRAPTRRPSGTTALAIELAQWLPACGPGPAGGGGAGRQLGRAIPSAPPTWAADALAQSGAAGPADRARLLERLGRYRWEAGDPAAAVDATEQAVALLATGPPSALQARVLAALATWRMLLGEFGRRCRWREQAVAVAQAGRRGRRASPRAGDAGHHPGPARRTGRRAGRTAHLASRWRCRAGSIEDVVRAAANHMYLLCTAGRFAEALEVAREGGRRPGPWTRRPR